MSAPWTQEECTRLLYLRQVEMKTPHETAALMGRSFRSVRVKLTRLRKKIRDGQLAFDGMTLSMRAQLPPAPV